jgi:hypothetical protein
LLGGCGCGGYKEKRENWTAHEGFSRRARWAAPMTEPFYAAVSGER